MAYVTPKLPGTRDSYSDLDTSALTNVNFTLGGNNPNGVDENTQKGALSGAVASLLGNNLVGVGGATDRNKGVGIWIENAQGTLYKSSSGTASMKAAYWADYGLYETDLYELLGEDDTTPLVYAAGDKLYASKRGFLTKDATQGTGSMAALRVLGSVVKAPTPSDGVMTYRLQIGAIEN